MKGKLSGFMTMGFVPDIPSSAIFDSDGID